MTIAEKTRRKRRRFLLVIVCVFAMVFVLVALLEIYIRICFKAPSGCFTIGQSEAKINLGSLYVAQKEYFDQNGTFASHTSQKDCFDLLHWKPEPPLFLRMDRLFWWNKGKTRYNYYCDTAIIPAIRSLGGCKPDAPPPAVSRTGFTVYAIGNIDNDDQCDVWSVNDAKIPLNLENDVTK